MLTRRLVLSVLVLLLLFGSLAVTAQTTTPEPVATAQAAVEEAAPAANGTLIVALGHTHSAVRWLVVGVTVVALVLLIWGLVGSRPYDKLVQRVMLAFTILITLQWLIGIVYFFVWGVMTRQQWEHAAVMTVAMALAHVNARFKNAPPAIRYRNSLLIVIAVLVLVFIGVALLPQGWRLAPTMTA
jgi:hypothetical protein